MASIPVMNQNQVLQINELEKYAHHRRRAVETNPDVPLKAIALDHLALDVFLNSLRVLSKGHDYAFSLLLILFQE